MFIVFISNSFKDTGNTLLWRNYSFWEYCFLKWSRRFGWCMKIHASARKGSLCNIWFSYLRDVYQNISNITNINSQYFLNQGSRDGLRPLFRNFLLFGPLREYQYIRGRVRAVRFEQKFIGSPSESVKSFVLRASISGVCLRPGSPVLNLNGIKKT